MVVGLSIDQLTDEGKQASLLGGSCWCGWGDHLTDSLVRPGTASKPFVGKTKSGKPRGKHRWQPNLGMEFPHGSLQFAAGTP